MNGLISICKQRDRASSTKIGKIIHFPRCQTERSRQSLFVSTIEHPMDDFRRAIDEHIGNNLAGTLIDKARSLPHRREFQPTDPPVT